MPKNPIEAIAFAGEQVISYLDELTRLACPRCGEEALTPTIVGTNLVIRCSEFLQDYNSGEEEPLITGVCDYIQVIKKTSITQEPFTLKFKEGRATSRNLPKKAPQARRRKRSSN